MKRIIKFRAWDSYHKIWFQDGAGFALSWDATEIFDDNSNEHSTKDIVFEQFTGLLDKNGMEIYEGDIVLLHDHPTGVDDCKTFVSFRAGCFVADFNGITLNDYGTAWIQVIGNIHQNPELL